MEDPSVTEPKRSLSRPVRPWVPMTRRSYSLAASTMVGMGTPSFTSPVASTPLARARSKAFLIASSPPS